MADAPIPIRADDLALPPPNLFGQIQAAAVDAYLREDCRETARALGRVGIFSDSDHRYWQLGHDRDADIELPTPVPTPIDESLDDGDTMSDYHDPASTADIDHRFNYHRPSPERVAAHEDTRTACRDLAHLLDQSVPPSREKSLALTKLEEAMMWANAAIARHR